MKSFKRIKKNFVTEYKELGGVGGINARIFKGTIIGDLNRIEKHKKPTLLNRIRINRRSYKIKL